MFVDTQEAEVNAAENRIGLRAWGMCFSTRAESFRPDQAACSKPTVAWGLPA